MNEIKKIACFFFISLSYFSIRSSDESFTEYDFFNDPITNAFVEQTDWHITREKQDIIDTLDDLKIIDLLKEDFFLNTNPLNSRSLLDNPFSLLQHCYYSSHIPETAQHNYGLHFFFNQMTRMVFRKDSTGIESYLAIRQKDFLEKLRVVTNQIEKIIPNFDINPDRVTFLIRNLTVQERRTGFMFYGKHTLPGPLHEITISWKMPFYLLERNYFTTDKERAALEAELGALEEEDQIDFEDEHLVATKLGFGDARISIDAPMTRSQRWAFNLGGFIDIPTALTFTRGVIRGTRRGLKKVTCRPRFNLELLLDDNALANNTAETAATEFVLAALDHFGGNLLDTPLGNGGHVGIGAIMYSKMPLDFIIRRSWAHNFRIKSRYSIQYLFPKRETRCYIACNNAHEFDKRNFEDTNRSDDNFNFLAATLTNRLFPFAFNTTVHPNIIVRSTTSLLYKAHGRGFSIGTDGWARTKESLRNIQTPKNFEKTLEVIKARRPFAYQSKLFASIFLEEMVQIIKYGIFACM